MGLIKISGMDHFIHEHQAWTRALDYLLQENAYMKTRLSQVVDHNTDKVFVDKAEYYQSAFIQNDDHIKDILRDIRAQQELLKVTRELREEQNEKQLSKKQQTLRNEMEHFEKKFALLKSDFNQYLLSNL